ncbi:MAG TPA: hypothetical protein ENK86_06815 [Campylobacterales bacterium]|nr:hypothetical protein [Campylobacterales bacterium]
MEAINALLAKYDDFRDAQFYSITAPSKGTYVVTLAVLDEDGMEATHHVKLTFSGATNVRLLENSMLGFLDMMSGVSIVYERDLYGFAIGRCSAMLNVQSAPLYLIAPNLEIEEVTL